MVPKQCLVRPWLPALWLLFALLPPAARAAPAAPAAQPAQPTQADWHYRIRPGDTLIELTAAYLAPGRSWRDLQRLNKVADPLRLPPGGVLRLPLAWLHREAAVAQALFIQGEVKLQRGSGPAQALAAGSELHAGDLLITGAGSSASLRFADGSRLLINPDSRVRLAQLLRLGRSGLHLTQLQLDQGGIENSVRPDGQAAARYQVRAPRLNLGVRGTEFRVQSDARGSRAQVSRGLVAAELARGELAIPAGYGALASSSAAAGAPPQLRALPAAPDLRPLQTLQQRLPLRLDFATQAGASAYRAQLFAAERPELPLLDQQLAGPPWLIADDLPDGAYRLRLRAIATDGLEGLDAEAALTVKARPEPPLIQAPAAAAVIYGESLRLAWAQVLAASQGYRLQLGADADLAQPLLDREISAAELPLSLAPGRYHWRLRSLGRAADGSADPGPWGDVQTFTLRALPPSPALEPPALGEQQLQLRWRAEPGMRYQLQLADDAAFSQGLREFDAAEPQLRLPRPAAGRHFLRLRSIDVHGQAGPWGGTQLIEVPQPPWLWLLPLGLLLLGL